ncbi:hypothetical protein evm_011790 [Chilo suppressalis]|nr:hypothetical protein evm_011790 [Chilo suppressalis]
MQRQSDSRKLWEEACVFIQQPLCYRYFYVFLYFCLLSRMVLTPAEKQRHYRERHKNYSEIEAANNKKTLKDVMQRNVTLKI